MCVQARRMPGPLRRLGACIETLFGIHLTMITIKSLFAAALLSTTAAVSFAQAPVAPKATVGSAPVAATTAAPAAPAASGAKKHHKLHAAKKADATAVVAPVVK